MEKQLVITAKLEDVNSISKQIVVDVPADMVKKSVLAALSKLKKDANLPGFRKGKAPDSMIKKRMGKSYDEEIIRQVVQDTYPEAVRIAGAAPISDPRIDAGNMEIDETKPFTYKATFEIYPKVEAKDYTGLKLEKEKVTVNDDEVEAELVALQRQMTQLEPAPDGIIEKGVLARVDFSGHADGKKFEGSEAQDFIVDLDAGNILPEFEKQLAGMKPDEERDIAFVYPADYFNKDIAGKQGTFHVKVKELRRKVVPALDDSFAKDLGPFKTLGDVKKALKERIHAAKENYQRANLHRQVIESLSKNQPIDVPDVMVSTELGHMLEEISHRLEQEGKTLKDAGIEANAFVKAHLDEARLRVRGYILTQAISEAEKVEVADDEVAGRITAIAMQSGQKEAQVRQHMEKNDLIPGLRNQMLMEKTLDFVIEKAKIKEKTAKKENK